MKTYRAELLKLKRSLSWSVVLALPLIVVLGGFINTLAAGEGLDGGWHTLWLRSVVFYGLFPLPVGIGILASLVWRTEHRGGNWNALMSGPTPTFALVAAKAGAVATLAVGMQAVLLLSIVVTGKLIFGLEGVLPASYWGVGLLIALACIPVSALQSGLSLFMRSFAAPIAVAFVGAGVSVVLLMAEVTPALFVLPYAVTARASQLGTGMFADEGSITAGVVAMTALAALVLTGAVIAATAAIVDRRDVHA